MASGTSAIYSRVVALQLPRETGPPGYWISIQQQKAVIFAAEVLSHAGAALLATVRSRLDPRTHASHPWVMNAASSIAFGMLNEAHARRRRRRSVGLVVALAVVTAVVVYGTTGGPRQPTRGPAPATPSTTLLRGATLRLPTGSTTKTFTIAAPAGLAYDVRITAPARSAVGLAMRIAPGTGWTLGTGDNAACRASSGRTACLWHFAAGGNPGGAWTAVVRKDTEPGASVGISIMFLKPHTSHGPPS